MNQKDRREKISEIIGNIDDKYIYEAGKAASEGFSEETRTNSRKNEKALKLPVRKGWIAAAAAALVLLLGGMSAVVISAEAKEYRKAVTFFEENDLPMEGLSRAEVKEVYRDITTRTFTSPKTEEVIRERVAGLEILQDAPTPEELASIWDESPWQKVIRKNGDSYQILIEWKRTEKEIVHYRSKKHKDIVVTDEPVMTIISSSLGFDKSIVEFYHDAELAWSADITEFSAEECLLTSMGTIVWGREDSGKNTRVWLARIDETGQVLWAKALRPRFSRESAVTVLDDGDGTFTLVTQGDGQVCFSRYDADCNQLDTMSAPLGEYGVAAATRLGDGYLLQLRKWNDQCLARMDADGTMHDPFRIEDDDCDYFISDMVEFEGKIYLSARAVPPAEPKRKYRNDLTAVLLDIMWRPDVREMTSEELTPLIRSNYTAVLLVLDPESGKPETFYSVEGCLGSYLHVRGTGKLEWEVQSITSSRYRGLNSYTVDGKMEIWQYTFDENGELLLQEDTGNTETFTR